MEAGKIRLIKSLVSYHATNKYYRDIASMIYVARLASNGKLTPADVDFLLWRQEVEVTKTLSPNEYDQLHHALTKMRQDLGITINHNVVHVNDTVKNDLWSANNLKQAAAEMKCPLPALAKHLADEDASLFMGRYDVKHPSRRSI